MPSDLNNGSTSPSPWKNLYSHILCFIHIQITCCFWAMSLTLMPAYSASHESTDIPSPVVGNMSQLVANFSDFIPLTLHTNMTRDSAQRTTNGNRAVVEKTVSAESDVPRDSPMALVIAASIAAVSILVFFVLAYLWHTHQLDSRARKLAIRLAADAEHGLRNQSSTPQPITRYARPAPRAVVSRAVSESSQEQNHYEALTPEDDKGHGSDGGRSSLVVSESDTGDNEDLFEPARLPPIGERVRAGARSGRGSHRKWSRTRKTSSGVNLDKRDSAVTDKDILTHFASRRHSTFFI